MGLYEQFVNMGAFTGKQMKAINAFTTSANGSYLSTPFFCGDYLIASDTFCCLRIKKDAYQQKLFPADSGFAYKLPDDALKKMLVNDVFYFSNVSDGLEFIKVESKPKESTYNYSQIREVKELNTTGQQIIQMFDEVVNPLTPEQVAALNVCGFQPKYLKMVTNLAEAFNISCLNFEYYNKDDLKFPLVKVNFPYYPDIEAFICPMLKKGKK